MSNLSERIIQVMWEQSSALSNKIDVLLKDNYPDEGIFAFLKQIKGVNEGFLTLFSNVNFKKPLQQSKISIYNILLMRFSEV